MGRLWKSATAFVLYPAFELYKRRYSARIPRRVNPLLFMISTAENKLFAERLVDLLNKQSRNRERFQATISISSAARDSWRYILGNTIIYVLYQRICAARALEYTTFTFLFLFSDVYN